MTLKIGIDLGTTNTLVAYEKKSKIRILKFGNSDMLKSALYYADKEIIIGEKAIRKGLMSPKNIISSSKTFMGNAEKEWQIEDRIFTPTDVAAEILKKLKERVIKKIKSSLDEEIEAVITVPAYFTSNQIDETKKAGIIAGLKVERIVTEPVAAAIAYAEEIGDDEKIFVVDLGGGTFDVSILETSNSQRIFNTLAIEGNKKLGGDDFTKAIFEMIIDKIKNDENIDLSSFEKFGRDDESEFYALRARLLFEAEEAKIDLSGNDSTSIEISNLFYHNGRNYNLSFNISLSDFDRKVMPLYDEIEKTIRGCLGVNNFFTSDIDRVILVGGSSNNIRIRKIVKSIFGFEPYADGDLSTLVVIGATLLANNGNSIQNGLHINDIISHSLGIKVVGHSGKNELEKLLIKNKKYPCWNEKLFTTSSDYQEEVSIDIYEGEIEDNCELNEFYGGFVLDGIEKAKKGIPKIRVKFKFDSSRILTVIAEDLRTGSKREVQVKKGVKEDSPKSRPIDFAILIDRSGSMSGRAMDLAKQASRDLVNEIIDLNTHRLGVIAFGSNVDILSSLTQDKGTLLNAINSISVHGGTYMTAAFNKSVQMLQNSSNEKIAIVVTDGAPNSRSGVISATTNAKNQGIRIIAIGVGGGVDSNYLRKITSSYEDYHYVDDMSKLKETFESVINALQKK